MRSLNTEINLIVCKNVKTIQLWCDYYLIVRRRNNIILQIFQTQTKTGVNNILQTLQTQTETGANNIILQILRVQTKSAVNNVKKHFLNFNCFKKLL